MKCLKMVILLCSIVVMIIGVVVEVQCGLCGGQGYDGMCGGVVWIVMMMWVFDVNGDNIIMCEEVVELQFEMFVWMDCNVDGYLDEEDMFFMNCCLCEMCEWDGGDDCECLCCCGCCGGLDGGLDGYCCVDVNGDGCVFCEEFMSVEYCWFEWLDIDENGVIMLEELDVVVECCENWCFWWCD